jgi:glycosyltransferase involved in cell wall biosynthesis
MKILMTTLLDMERDRNGVVTVAHELRNLLEASGYPVRMITPKNAALPDRSSVLRITRRFWQATKSPGGFLLQLMLTLKNISRRIASQAGDIDAVIAHDVLTADAALSTVAGDCPILLVCHFWTKPWDEFSDAGLLPKHGIAINWLRRKMEKVLNNPRILLVPVSRRNEKLLHDILPDAPQNRIQLAYPGVSQPAGLSIPKQQSEGIPSIINVGTLEQRKNQRVLPYLASALKEIGFPCRFLLVGTENSDERILIATIIARLQVDDFFTFYGKLERDAVFKLMANADLYLHTSLEESFGMTLVEAMACNLPVMALAYEALSEILPDTPEAVIPQDATPEQIAAMIAPLLSNSQRRNDLQTRQHAVYQRRFSASAFVSRYLEIIASAARMNS